MHGKIWSDMFILGLPVLEKVLRPLIVYGILIAGLRVAGKRELAQLNPFDLVVLLTLSNTVQNAIIGDDNTVTGGLIGAATLLVVNYFAVRFLYGHNRLERLLEGDPDLLVDKGKVLQGHCKDELITLSELEAAAHRQGFGSLEDVERAVLEPGGTLSFIAKVPTVEDTRHGEIIDRLERLIRDLAELRAKPSSA
jgi:uncharacterized membrane protein YcaP (DUF421 family)